MLNRKYIMSCRRKPVFKHLEWSTMQFLVSYKKQGTVYYHELHGVNLLQNCEG